MCVIDGGERCEVFTETWRKARKAHTCDSCHGVIAPGVRYLVNFALFEGHASSEKLCAPCDADRKVFSDAHGGNFIPSPSGFPELLQECVWEGNREGDPESKAKWEPMLETLRARRVS